MDKSKLAACFTVGNLMESSAECYRGVRWKGQPQRFMDKRLTNCKALRDEILAGRYSPKPVEPFEVNERGKVREVKPVAFRDRVAQRCFCDRVLVPAIERYAIDGCSAVLPGRGLSYAFSSVRDAAARCPPEGWVLRFDFSDYFHSIDKAVVLDMTRSLVCDDGLYRFAATVIMDDERGLELGSHVSQLLATALPTPLDRRVSGLHPVTGYHRYMDDGIAFCETRGAAMAALDAVVEEAEALRLRLNPKKVSVNPICQPFAFCKMRFTKLATGEVRQNVRKQQTRRAVRHARSVKKLAERVGGIDLAPVEASLRGYVNGGDVNLDRLADEIFGARET